MDIELNKKCIIYCRVSSKEQEDRGYSLEAQEKLLTEYAIKKELNTIKIFKISESASGKQIRKTFNEMLVYVKKKRINIILCEKIDRLTRNLKDGAVVSDWVNGNDDRQVHFVKENFIVSKNTRAHENLVWDMKVAIARFYTNNLSEEVKKGQIAKLEAGWIPNGQKLGYNTIGEKGHKIHVPDEKFAPFIKRAFELYNSGNYTITRLTNAMQKEGMKNRSNKKIGRSTLHALLSDPFYCGIILWNNEEYAGKHEPIITRGLFNEVQEKMKRIYKTGQIKKHDHIFKGLIKCGDCGCLITWETQKGHNYGHCKGFKPCQEKGYIREEKIENNIKNYYEVGVEIHDLAYKAKELFLSGKSTVDDKKTLVNKIFSGLKLKDKKLIAEYTPAYQFLSEWIPKLNATSELLKHGKYYEKTGSFEPACPILLPGSDSNRRPIG